MEAGGPLLDNLNLFNELITRLSDAGYASDDIQWAENTKPPEHAEEFATETIFVICNSGMKHTIARKILDKRSEEHTSELQSLMRISYAVFCLKKKQHIKRKIIIKINIIKHNNKYFHK